MEFDISRASFGSQYASLIVVLFIQDLLFSIFTGDMNTDASVIILFLAELLPNASSFCFFFLL